MTGYIILGATILIILIWFLKTYNTFKQKEEEVNQYKSGIDIALTNRYDTLTKLREAVKGYMNHENATFVQITEVRKGMPIKDLAVAEKQMQTAISEINAVAEQYPQLRASENFMMLQHTINSTEENLQIARRCYNAGVTDFNKRVVSIPSCLVAPIAGAKRYDFFEADAEKRNDVQMSF